MSSEPAKRKKIDAPTSPSTNAGDHDHRKRRRNRTTQSCLHCHASKRMVSMTICHILLVSIQHCFVSAIEKGPAAAALSSVLYVIPLLVSTGSQGAHLRLCRLGSVCMKLTIQVKGNLLPVVVPVIRI